MKKKILVAPLNWGLGHATRCIPIIHALIENGFEPVIASDGAALELLKKEFPELIGLELPSYNIKYPINGSFFKLKLLKDSPKVLHAIHTERKAVNQIIATHDIRGLISDNRFGVYSKKIPCVFMTHQLRVLSGSTTWLSSKMHQKIIAQFDECWVPDAEGHPNLSGKLGHASLPNCILKYIGPLSRFTKQELELRYDLTVLLSGPEPQRSLLEEKLLLEFKNYEGTILFVKGVMAPEQTSIQNGTMTICNYLIGMDLETALNESKLIVSRSGYTTIMDLAKLGKKAFFIPTPGQFEQEYLANRLTEEGFVPSCKQTDFTIEKLKEVSAFKGLTPFDDELNYKKLFLLFEGE